MLGERLEEARKRKSVSIREAAEATKIRGDYLLAMEDNSFDIDLPQIYIRGFLRNYARFLKLDPNKALTDYDAHMLGKANRSQRPGNRDSLGQVSIAPSASEAELEAPSIFVTEGPAEDFDEPTVSIQERSKEGPTTPPPTLERKGTRRDQELWNENKNLYIKIGIISAGVLIIGVICLIFWQMLRSDSQPVAAINPELASTQRTGTATSVTSLAPQDSPVVISATDNVVVIVEQTIDRKRLYSGSLNAGETISLERQGPVSLRFTNGTALTIEVDGRQLRPNQEGLGRTVID
jgi:cytoskeleton protein RodZ